MTDRLKTYICSILEKAEEIAKETQSQIDDFLVAMLKKIFGCEE